MAEAGVDFTTDITIGDINALVVKFNGNPIPYDVVHSGGNDWKVTVYGASIPTEGTLTYWDTEPDEDYLLKTVPVAP